MAFLVAAAAALLLCFSGGARAAYGGPSGNARVLNVSTTMQCVQPTPISVGAGATPACPVDMLRVVTMVIVDLYLEEDYQNQLREGGCSGGGSSEQEAARTWAARPALEPGAALSFFLRPNATGLLRRLDVHDSLHRLVSPARIAVACEPRAPVGLHLVAPLDGADAVTRCTVTVHRPPPPLTEKERTAPLKKQAREAPAPVVLLVDNSAAETLFAADTPDLDVGAVVRATVARDEAAVARALAFEHQPPTVVAQLFERGAALGLQLIERPHENARFSV